MAETRLEKYRKYRESLNEVKANIAEEDEEKARSRVVTSSINTTSTLPLDEVLGQIDEETEYTSNKAITAKKIKIAVLIILGALIIAGTIIFAIIAFGGNN